MREIKKLVLRFENGTIGIPAEAMELFIRNIGETHVVMYHGKPYQMTTADEVHIHIPANKTNLLQCSGDAKIQKNWIKVLCHLEDIMIQYADRGMNLLPGAYYNVVIVRQKDESIDMYCALNIHHK